jgi:hypothetical protein
MLYGMVSGKCLRVVIEDEEGLMRDLVKRKRQTAIHMWRTTRKRLGRVIG